MQQRMIGNYFEIPWMSIAVKNIVLGIRNGNSSGSELIQLWLLEALVYHNQQQTHRAKAWRRKLTILDISFAETKLVTRYDYDLLTASGETANSWRFQLLALVKMDLCLAEQRSQLSLQHSNYLAYLETGFVLSAAPHTLPSDARLWFT